MSAYVGSVRRRSAISSHRPLSVEHPTSIPKVVVRVAARPTRLVKILEFLELLQFSCLTDSFSSCHPTAAPAEFLAPGVRAATRERARWIGNVSWRTSQELSTRNCCCVTSIWLLRQLETAELIAFCPAGFSHGRSLRCCDALGVIPCVARVCRGRNLSCRSWACWPRRARQLLVNAARR